MRTRWYSQAMPFLRLLAAAALLASACSTTPWPDDDGTVPMLVASGFRVARAEDGPLPPGLRPGRVCRRIDSSRVRYFFQDPRDQVVLAGTEEAYMRYQQLRLGRAQDARPSVFLGFSYGAPVGF